ncbi:MAG: FAD-dependent oxidoreductase [Alphaproteobacteria bacterium]|nr:FAD-dependent oxidoreductase [Alphaproteobacteria bacterium]
MTQARLPDRARIVIIGGGAVGCSIAYHLAKEGERDVLLLEKSGLTHGSTWHAAGLVGQLRSKRNLTRLMQDSVRLYAALTAETGQEIEWRPAGSLRLASSKARWSELKRSVSTARSFGFDIHTVSPAEARKMFPLIALDGVVGAVFVPTDGYVDPTGLTMAYAKGARAGGAKLLEGVRVTGIETKGRRATRVVTDRGTVECEILVNAAGMWADRIGAMAGVKIPAVAVEHQYMVTEKSDAIPKGLPTLRDPDNAFYLKPDVSALAIGGWEPNTIPFGRGGIPFEFGRELLPSDFERFEQIALPATARLPILEKLGVRTLINGPIPISPDGEPILGKAPELDNFFVACGFTSGIAASGGAGKAMAQWIVHGEPERDLWAFDVRRFGLHHMSGRYRYERAVESYHRYYLIHWPVEELSTGRGGRRSPLNPLLKRKGAVFGSRFGWERPNWFALDGVEAKDIPSFEGRPSWFGAVAAEHKATRERVTLFDQSSFSKFEVDGPGAFQALQRIAANDLDRPPGTAIYTQLCNERGGIEADLTIMRMEEGRFYVVTGSAFGVRDGGWIRRHLPTDGSVAFRDVTSAKAVINICGPRSRAVLAKVAEGDLANGAFPYLAAREIRIGYAPVLAVRITYVGELGWELHVPVEYAAHLYETLWEAGAEFGIADAGYRAIETLRLEKRYLYWGADITPDYNPYEAGLGFAVALDKGEFIGRSALARARAEGPKRKLCVFLLDEPVSVYGGEAIYAADGRVLGVTSSGGFGHTIQKSIVYGYVPIEDAKAERYEIEAFMRRIPATRIDKAPYDPERKKLLA